MNRGTRVKDPGGPRITYAVSRVDSTVVAVVACIVDGVKPPSWETFRICISCAKDTEGPYISLLLLGIVLEHMALDMTIAAPNRLAKCMMARRITRSKGLTLVARRLGAKSSKHNSWLSRTGGAQEVASDGSDSRRREKKNKRKEKRSRVATPIANRPKEVRSFVISKQDKVAPVFVYKAPSVLDLRAHVAVTSLSNKGFNLVPSIPRATLYTGSLDVYPSGVGTLHCLIRVAP
ncbi:conserved hypothetical protein [Ricinus communis]|uniref:Uncharacterized protein n=1 Tax=Ricinus communis TaxID=3988 RepID=B9S5B0_RICCO|nr:conserved hypothetical protein [Ricinus communis]